MFWTILHRMIFLELARIFALSLLGITGILVMAGIVAEATQQGLGPAQVLAVIPLLIPSTLPYTIPATTLFATCLVYGRLAHDNEILAIKAAGINVLHVIFPGAFLGLLMSLGTMVMYMDLIPSTHRALRSRFLNDVEEYMYALLQKDRCIRQPGMNYAMWVKQVQGRRLREALFKRQDEKGNYDIIARAREAYLHVDMPNKKLIVTMRHGEVLGGESNRGYFEERDWDVPLPDNLTSEYKPRPRAMTWRELREQRSELLAEREQVSAEIALQTARSLMSNCPLDLPQHIRNLKNILRRHEREINDVNAELNMRPAISFGCLFFVLIGCPVGIWFSKSDYLSAFITCFLPIVFLYYPLLLCSTNLAKDGKLPALLALWLANGVMAVVSPVLYWNLLKH